MSEKALATYLNDHLGGATLGGDLANQILERAEGPPLEPVMAKLAPEIDADRETLVAIMEALDVSRNPVKQVTGWIAEKASRAKFTGITGDTDELGLFMAIETLRLGVAGKRCLWLALSAIAPADPRLSGFDFDALGERAAAQETALEAQRLLAAPRVLAAEPATA
jgi:hypothetical protein